MSERGIRIGLISAGVLLLGMAGILTLDLTRTKIARKDLALAEARDTTRKGAERISLGLQDVESLLTEVTEALRSMRMGGADSRAFLKAQMEEDQWIYRLAVVSTSSGEVDTTETSVKGWVRSGQVLEPLVEIPSLTFGSEPAGAQRPSETGTVWLDPQWDPEIRKVVLTLWSPVSPQSEETDFVYLSFAAQTIKEWLSDLRLDEMGWPVLMSHTGRFLIHPDENLLRQDLTIWQVLELERDEAFRKAAENTLSGESGMFAQVNRLTGQPSWFLYEPIKLNGWTFAVVRIIDQVLSYGHPLVQRILVICILAVFGLAFLSVYLAAALYSRYRRKSVLWVTSGWVSLLLITAFLIIRFFAFHEAGTSELSGRRILDQAGLASILDSQAGEGNLGVLVGVFIHTMQFDTPKDLSITGICWQKIPNDTDVELTEGLNFSDSIDSNFTEIYRKEELDYDSVGWAFDATMRQELDASRYPLDHETIDIRLWPRDLAEGIQLIPDLEAYPVLNPALLPGLREGLQLSGWQLTGSFFNYQVNDPGLDLGILQGSGSGTRPELQFSIVLKRNLLDVAIRHGIPLIVVLIMLFAVVVTSTRDPDKSKMIGFSPSGVTRLASALFFVVLLAHIQLRSSIDTQQVVLMELAYITTYLTIIAVAVHNFVFQLSGLRSWIVDYEEGLIFKLLYWPTILAVLLVSIAAMLY